MHASTLAISCCMYSYTQKYFLFSAYCSQHYPAHVAKQDLEKVPGWALCCCYAKAPRHWFLPVIILNLYLLTINFMHTYLFFSFHVKKNANTFEPITR